ncbi:Protein timeless-like [Holothuria leucospilota]|uniref:Protein timeless-like n=1 Tax=Holothuria leucospilota TaxID=206669 RepID=A0A9Q1H5E2_HOLLE|nr:Protein timeless-like [Holothuria leucospilota]
MAADITQMPMNPELVAACNALGYREGDKYMKEPYCLETIKDLIRYLRREDETCDIRRQLGAAQILQNDLIPIVTQYSRQSELLETCIRLMVNLTQPVDLCFSKPEMKGDKAFQSYGLEILSHQQAYKEAFGDEDFMACLAEKLKKLLEKPWERRREDDTLLMERILVLVRNILHVPADPNAEKRTDDDASVHDRVLWGMNTSGMDKLILYIASSEGEQHWCIHAAEIISRMLREQSPEVIAKAGVSTAFSERKKEMAELEAIREREREEKRARQLKLSSRHSRFGGTFQVKNLKSISEYDVIYHRKLPKDVNSISFELDKPLLKRPKHRLPMQDMTLMRKSTLSIRLFLKDFCLLFLENCYNPMMYNVKDHILHQRAQENDDSYYLWTMRFFMEFNRFDEFQVDQISETFSIQTFHYVQMQILKYLEMLTTDKNELTNWARRLHLALKAYRELLLTLNTISNHPDETVRESAKVVESNVFYVIEYREILLVLLRKYTDIKNTRTFLIDLVDTTHLYLKMLEKYCKGKKNVFVQKKKRKKTKRRKTKRKNEQGEAAASREAELNESWDNIAGDLSAMLQGREDIPENVVPFDAASEQPVEEQRADTMVRIQHCLHNGQAGDGIALLRAAREVWPDGDIFGAADIAPEDEFMALREIHFTNLNAGREAPAATEEWPEEELDDEEYEELEAENDNRAEEEFHFGVFVNQFSHSDILRNYVHLLESFRTNTPYINHCIIKMLHRVAVDCQKAPKLFQISLFYIFHQVLNDPIAKTSQYKEIVKFAHYIMKEFFVMVPKNPKIFMELFFWKDNKEIFELAEGYGAAVRQSTGGDIGDWDDDLKKELTELFNQFREVQGPKDAVDHIMEKISDESKTRKQIIRQLVNMDLIGGIGEMKRTKGAKRVAIWREEQVEELKSLFAEYREADDIMKNIMDDLIEPRPRTHVVEKLLELNLIKDKKELYKKKNRGAQRRRRRRGKGVEEVCMMHLNGLRNVEHSVPHILLR